MPGSRTDTIEEAPDPAALAARIDALLGELRGDARARAVGENLVRALMQFYGAAFERALDLVAADARPLIDTLAADPLVGSVMLLHDLHPEDRERRLAEALARAREAIDDPGVSLSVVVADAQRIRVRLAGAAPAKAGGVRSSILRVLRESLPEVPEIDFDDPPPATVAPLQLCRADGTPVSLPHASKEREGWSDPPGAGTEA